jgi:hypothetical protein
MVWLLMIYVLFYKKSGLVGFEIVFWRCIEKENFFVVKKKESGPPRGPKTDFKTH